MNENKRFRSSPTDDYNFADIMDGKEWIGICHVDSADDFCNKLNELNDDMEYWRQTACQKENEINVLTHKLHKKGDMNE